MHESESEVSQLCPTLRDPHGLQPTRLLHPWDFPGKSTGVGCHYLLPLTLYFDLIALIIINGRNRTKTLIGSDPHKIVIPMNKSQFENALQTLTDF